MADVVFSDLTPNYAASGNYIGGAVQFGYGMAPPANNYDANIMTGRRVETVLPIAVEVKLTGRFSPQEG